jgi:hypothetical protein
MIEPGQQDDDFFEVWDLDDEGSEPLSPPPWRKPLLIAVAALTAVAMALVPLYNVFFATTVADNGLEVCGFDYCIVQEAVREAGVDLVMSRLSTSFLDEHEAQDLADRLTEQLDIDPIRLQVVQDLDGRLGGFYDAERRAVSIESPARAWTVLHEVAHAMETGHGEPFQQVVVDLALWLASTSS